MLRLGSPLRRFRWFSLIPVGDGTTEVQPFISVGRIQIAVGGKRILPDVGVEDPTRRY